MPKVVYENEKTVETQSGSEPSLLDLSLDNGIQHVHACGGHGRCSTCRVIVLSGADQLGEVTQAEKDMAQSKHLSPNVRLACQTRVQGDATVRRLVLDDEDLADAASFTSGGQAEQVAILFSDLRGFTAFSRDHMPYDVIHMLNRHFRRMGDAVLQNGGAIDKYVGDGIMAVFGAGRPTDEAASCKAAIGAAVQMLEGLGDVNRYVEKALGASFEIGIGIHYGQVIGGEIGHPGLRHWTSLGDNVNLARRIEAATKQAGASILISETVQPHVPENVKVGRSFKVQIRGQTGEHRLFEILAPADTTSSTPGPAAPTGDLYRIPVVAVERIATDTLALRLDTRGTGYTFQPGQNAKLSLEADSPARVLSIASAAGDELLMATRLRAQSDFKQALLGLSPGMYVYVAPASGNFALDDSDRPAVFLAGGIGITAVRGILEQAVKEASSRPLTVFFSNRERSDAAFLGDIFDWQEELPNLKLVPTLTRAAGDDWTFEQGRITTEMIRKYVSAPQDAMFYVSGPTEMNDGLCKVLEGLGVKADQIRTETYAGY